MAIKKLPSQRQDGRTATGSAAKRAKTQSAARLRKLNAEVVELRKENAMLRKNLIALLHEDLSADKNSLLKQAALGPSIVDIVNAMDRRGE